MRYQGRLTRWEDEKGFGFITPDETGPDMFIHISEFSHRQRRPEVGDQLSYEIGQDADARIRAERTKLEGNASANHSHRLRSSFGPLAIVIIFITFLFLLILLQRIPLWLAFAYIPCSVVAFSYYACDKLSAQRNEWRIPEGTLLMWGLLCGWPGAILGQQFLRHKSSKMSFQSAFWFTVLLNMIAVCFLAILGDLEERIPALIDIRESIPTRESASDDDEKNSLPRIIPHP